MTMMKSMYVCMYVCYVCMYVCYVCMFCMCVYLLSFKKLKQFRKCCRFGDERLQHSLIFSWSSLGE